MKAYAVSKTNRKANVVGVRAGDSSVAERTGLACENLDSILSTLKKTITTEDAEQSGQQLRQPCVQTSNNVVGLFLNPNVNKL